MDLLQPPGHPIAYFPSLAPHVGGTKAAVLLNQLSYWTPRTKDADGWIYKTQEDLCLETGLSLKEQRTARESLKRLNLIEEKYERLNHRLWLRLNITSYNEFILLISHQMPKGYFGKCQKGISGNAKRERREVPKGHFDNTSLSETTTETTTENTDTPLSPHGGRESVLNGFLAFWEQYPRKKSKGEARKAWMVLKPDPALCERILVSLVGARRSADWLKDRGAFIPYPASWLRAEGWEDEHVMVRDQAEEDARLIALVEQREAEDAAWEESRHAKQ